MKGYCCGFGHREYYKEVKSELQTTIKHLIDEEGISVFLTGGMGDFDSLFSATVRSYKTHYKDIKLILVKPYFSNELNINKEFYQSYYDDIIIPQEIAGCYFKSAITKRNKWMIDKSDFVISGVYQEYGGAYDTIKYAQKNNKQIIELCTADKF